MNPMFLSGSSIKISFAQDSFCRIFHIKNFAEIHESHNFDMRTSHWQDLECRHLAQIKNFEPGLRDDQIAEYLTRIIEKPFLAFDVKSKWEEEDGRWHRDPELYTSPLMNDPHNLRMLEIVSSIPLPKTRKCGKYKRTSFECIVKEQTRARTGGNFERQERCSEIEWNDEQSECGQAPPPRYTPYPERQSTRATQTTAPDARWPNNMYLFEVD